MEFALLYIVLFVLLIDAIYLSLFGGVWKDTVQHIQKKPLRMNPVATFLAYICLCLGIYVFVWYPFHHTSIACISTFAFLWGILSYGLFNFTNAAIFAHYPVRVIVQDTLWGGILATIVIFLTKRLVYGI